MALAPGASAPNRIGVMAPGAHLSSTWRWLHGALAHRRLALDAVPVGVGVATYAAPVSGCTCLIKEYLEDGSVRFTDTCTKEFAVSPPPPPPSQN
jgi:hypothetical protein